MYHSFNVEIATKHGYKSAIVLDILQRLKSDKSGIATIKISDLLEIMPYFTEQAIQRSLNNLEMCKYITMNNGYVLINNN